MDDNMILPLNGTANKTTPGGAININS